jgi:hypothetical protein
MGYLHQGRIFWREVPNLHGDGEKVRPLVIVSTTAQVNDRGTESILCVACSHSAADRDPLPPGCVLLPPKSGKQETKLNKPTAAVAQWLVEVPKTSIADRDLAGSIGGALLAEVLRAVNAYQPVSLPALPEGDKPTS